MISFAYSASSSFYNAVISTAFVLLAPAVLAIPSLSEYHRPGSALTTMTTAFSPLAVTGYAVLAIVASYTLLHLYRFLKPQFISSAKGVGLPQPVSAGRTSSFYLYFPFASFRSRQRGVMTRSIPAQNRWSPLSFIYRRLTRRPSSPLHLSGTEHLLPTTMPDSPQPSIQSLIDLPFIPIISSESTNAMTKGRGQVFDKPKRRVSKASSMEALTAYRPLTPIPIVVPIPVHSPPPPSTPPPPSPIFHPGMTKSDIPLVPITPPKRRFTPTGISSAPPQSGTFSAISLSPFNSPATRVSSSTHHRVLADPGGGHLPPRPASPSPIQSRGTPNNTGLFSSSRTLSSLSLSPRSLYVMQQNKRSKSLGGVVIKKISPPQFHFDGVIHSEEENGQEQKARAPSTPGVDERENTMTDWKPVTPSGSLSPSPLTSNSDSPPSSTHLATPPSISNAVSYSSHSDIIKFSENEPLLPRPIPLVDIDGAVNNGKSNDKNVALDGWSFDGADKNVVVDGWSFDEAEEPVTRALGDSEDDMSHVYAITHDPPVCFGSLKSGEKSRKDTWGWDEDVEEQAFGWETEMMYEKNDAVSRSQMKEQAVPDEFETGVEPTSLDKGHANDFDSAAEPGIVEDVTGEELPDSDPILPPENVHISPPTISICTQDSLLCKKEKDNSECDSALSSSIERATPISLGQTPTPPASPPRENRISSLPKLDKALRDQVPSPTSVVTASPVVERSAVINVDVETQNVEEGISVLIPVDDVQDGEDEDISISIEEVKITEEEQKETEIVVLLDGPLVSSPASISSGLPESADGDDDSEFTFNIETAENDEDRDDEFRMMVVPPSPIARIEGWDYTIDDDPELENLEQEVEVEGSNGPGREEDATCRECDESEDSNVRCTKTTEAPIARVAPDPELLLDPAPTPQLPISAHTLDSMTHITSAMLLSAALSAPVLQSNASLPESFPDTATSPAEKLEPKPLQNNTLLSQPQTRRCARTPLEEAIARTRSPLEVALAMQLRPGLGLGADPAWMVRFLMVMWGWMFGMVLGPTVVEA